MRSSSDHEAARSALLELLEELPVFGGASAQLSRLAMSAEQVDSLLEFASSSQDALSELPDLQEALESLAAQHETVLELLELEELADAVDELANEARYVRRYRAELARKRDEVSEDLSG